MSLLFLTDDRDIDELSQRKFVTDNEKHVAAPCLVRRDNLVKLPEVQPPAAASYATVPVSINSITGKSDGMQPWVEPIRVEQIYSESAVATLEYIPDFPILFAFPRRIATRKVTVFIKPGLPVPPGLCFIQDGYHTILRHEVPYSFTPTAPIPGILHCNKAKNVKPEDFSIIFRAQQCPTFFKSCEVTVIISSTDKYNYSPARFSLLLPSTTGGLRVSRLNTQLYVL